MFDNYFFLTRIVDELKKELIGFEFFKSVSQSKNELVTGFFLLNEEKFLIFTFQKSPVLIYLKDQFAFAKKNYATFFEVLWGQKLKDISIDEFERNIHFHFDNHRLIFVFRGNHSNVLLVDENDLILESFKDKDKLTLKIFREVYQSSQLEKSFFTHAEKFDSLFSESDKNLDVYKKVIGKDLLKELHHRVKVNKKTYFENFKDILSEIRNSPLHVYDDGTVSFCRLSHKLNNFHFSNNYFKEIAQSYFSIRKIEEIEQLKSKLRIKLNKELQSLHHKLNKLDKPENLIDRSEDFRTIANIILIHANEIQKGQTQFKTEFEGKNFDIKLDPTLNPFENAEKYYEKAREENSRINTLKNLIQKTKKEIEEINNLITEIQKMEDYNKLKSIYEKEVQKSEKENLTKGFRHFILEGKYDVYVGKDSKSNDRLTVEFARNDDLWFHARGVSGSHVILRKQNKKENFPKNIIEKAASIAAYFSKAKKSKLAPVSYTEKKYVIKRKGMSPGTVQLLREKVIMVEPKLPINEIVEENLK